MHLGPTGGNLITQVTAPGAIFAMAMIGRVREVPKSIFRTFFRGRRWTGRR